MSDLPLEEFLLSRMTRRWFEPVRADTVQALVNLYEQGKVVRRPVGGRQGAYEYRLPSEDE